MDIAMTLHIALVAAGALLLIVALFGRAEGFSVKIPVTSSLAVRSVSGVFGAALLVASFVLYWIHYIGPVRIDSIEARWDATSANGCGGIANYTIQLTTSGWGQRSFGYTVRVDKGEWAGSVDVSTPGTTYDRKGTKFSYAFNALPRDVYLKVDIDGHARAISASPLHLRCDESTEELMHQTQTFFDSYRTQVLESGRASPAVTHYYYQFPLNWYGRLFQTEEEFVAYIRQGATSQTPTAAMPKCQYSNGRVSRILSRADPIEVETVVSWTNLQDGRSGQVLATYSLVRTVDPLRMRIQRVNEIGSAETC